MASLILQQPPQPGLRHAQPSQGLAYLSLRPSQLGNSRVIGAGRTPAGE
jgi:hypothetical protein